MFDERSNTNGGLGLARHIARMKRREGLGGHHDGNLSILSLELGRCRLVGGGLGQLHR